MTVVASYADEASLSRGDGDGGSIAATGAPRPRRDESDAERFVRFIRLVGVAEVRDGDVWFPLGILWPYTRDLRRVRAAFDEAGGVPTRALLATIATLQSRIAFAPGPAGRAVAEVYNETKDALAAALAR